MNKTLTFLAVTLVLGSGAAFWVRAQTAANHVPLPSLMPGGALMYLEAKDFRRLLDQWNGSAEKSKWIAGVNYSILANSRLLLRLHQTQSEFESALEVSPGMNLVNQLAGVESAFAFYDLSSLKFVFLTRMEPSRAQASALWRKRADYQPRQAAGTQFFVKTDKASGRTIAFASKDDLFIVSTSESLMAATLNLLAAPGTDSIANEAWFKQLATAPQGDLRLAYDLRAVGKTPQFRTYWIQQNQTELKQYAAGISDLFETASGFEEKRTLLRAAPSSPAAPASKALPQLAARISKDASLYRAWVQPSHEVLANALTQLMYGDATPASTSSLSAPGVELNETGAGTEADLETRIDEAAPQLNNLKAVDKVVAAVSAMTPTALLHIQTTFEAGDRVFILPEATVALLCEKPDLAALRRAVAETLGSAAQSGGLDPLTIALDGNLLLLARGESLLTNAPPPASAANSTPVYMAGYNHAAEWPKYTRLFQVLDGPKQPGTTTPTFFASNLQSIGDTLIRLQKETISRFDQGLAITETVHYQLK